MFVSFNSYPYTTKEDEIYLKAFLKDWKISDTVDSVHSDFEKEIEFISKIQDSVISQIRHILISYDTSGTIQYYYEKRKGFCYDRALLMEKILDLYKFRFRHAFVYYHRDSTAVSGMDFFSKGIASHALLEVKTKKGWMALGSNSNWLGIHEDGSVMDLPALREKLKQQQWKFKKKPTLGYPFYEETGGYYKFKYVYGVYSRHGRFLKSRPFEKVLNFIGIPSFIPDYNIRMLLYNF